MNTPKKIAVVILNWNGEKMMQHFLPSVVKYSEELADIIVADNCSTDGSLTLLNKDFPSVKQIILDKNYGFADGYNHALKQLKHEYFVLLNSDIEVDSNWLEPLLSYMESTPEVAACQPKILAQKNKAQFEYAGAAGGFLDHYGYPFCRGRILSEVETDQQQYNTICDILWASGAALFIRRSVWEISGGLDGRFFAHMEEIDLCWRLRNQGHRIVCIPESHVYHVGGGTLDQGNPRKTYLNFRNNLFMLYKNLSQEELKPIMRTRCLLDYVAAFKFLVTIDIANFKAVLKARKDYNKMREDFTKQREENLKKMSTSPKERTSYSILWKYYISGAKKYSDLTT